MEDKEWMEWLDRVLVPVKKLVDSADGKTKEWYKTHWELSDGAYMLLRELYSEGKLKE